MLRFKYCVEVWPECVDGEYNPACCRFPKSCSCDAGSAEPLTSLLVQILEFRREWFSELNNRLWGEGNWEECYKCPDSFGFPSFHSREHHKG